jgi:hypothetical protein
MAKQPRGRTKGFVMSDEHRVKIQNSNILNTLIQHVKGEREMSATQVTAGIALLKKVLPDLQAIEHSGGVSVSVTQEEMISTLEAAAAQTSATVFDADEHGVPH